MKKTKLTRSLLAACSIVALSAVMYGCVHSGGDGEMDTGMEMPMPDPAAPVDVPMDVALGAAEMAALLLALPDAGTSDTVDIPAGGSEIRNSVVFTCMSAYPCTVTVTNSLDKIIAEVSTQKLAGADDPMVTASVPPIELTRDPMVVGGADRANEKTVSSAIMAAGLIDTYTGFSSETTTFTAGDEPPAVDVNKLKYPGTFELQGDFVENQAEVTAPAVDPDPVIKSTSTDEDGGLTINEAGLAINFGGAGWRHHALERDWSHRLPDEPADAPLYGGFETNALVVENIGANKTRQFDKLFTPNANGELVSLYGDPTANAGYAMFAYDGQSGTYQNRKDANEDWRGSFAGVPGVYRCAAECWLVKDRKEGTVSAMAGDGGTPSGPDAMDFAALEFVPDNPKAMASVADWAYLTYGAWLTTPQNRTGQHSIGLISMGGGIANGLPDTEYFAELEGEAKYRGMALGYYATKAEDPAMGEVGAFTATAALTATFAATSTLKGTVSNFHDANGEAMDEFVVNLESTSLNATGGSADAAISGHGQGVPWATGTEPGAGAWTAQLGGVPDANVEGVSFTGDGVAGADIKDLTDAVAGADYEVGHADFPLGVTGRFDASNSVVSVTGAFGADLQPPASQ